MKRILCLILLVLPAAAQSRRVVAIAHRGEHLRNPENTMPAFQEAIRLGADYIELDVRTTADGKLVLMHDATVDRCNKQSGRSSQNDLDEIRALDAGIKKSPEFAGTKVPTFDEALDLARDKIGVYVDVKQVSAKDLVQHLEDHDMVDHVVIYSGRISKEIQDLNPKLKIMPESVSIEAEEKLVAALHPKVIAFGARDFTPEIIGIAKRANAEIYVDRMGDTDNPAGWQSVCVVKTHQLAFSTASLESSHG